MIRVYLRLSTLICGECGKELHAGKPEQNPPPVDEHVPDAAITTGYETLGPFVQRCVGTQPGDGHQNRSPAVTRWLQVPPEQSGQHEVRAEVQHHATEFHAQPDGIFARNVRRDYYQYPVDDKNWQTESAGERGQTYHSDTGSMSVVEGIDGGGTCPPIARVGIAAI